MPICNCVIGMSLKLNAKFTLYMCGIIKNAEIEGADAGTNVDRKSHFSSVKGGARARLVKSPRAVFDQPKHILNCVTGRRVHAQTQNARHFCRTRESRGFIFIRVFSSAASYLQISLSLRTADAALYRVKYVHTKNHA